MVCKKMWRPIVCGAFILAVLSGCSVLNNPVVTTLYHVSGLNSGTVNPVFNPNYRYIRVDVGGRTVFLVLGYIDQSTEVWYSAGHEVLRVRDGHIAGATGLFTEWRNVILPNFPAWNSIAVGKSWQWTRIRDVMPGYYYGIHDQLVVHAIAPPSNSHLKNIPPEQLAWFEEDDESARHALPPARYAVDLRKDKVIYGESCLSATLCFSWQQWPVSK